MLVNAPSNSLAFSKMHGAGNDFVIIDSQGRPPVVTAELARAIGDRHRGVGFDQLAEIRTSDDADIQIDFWNADGSTAGACGNATRCIVQQAMAGSGRKRMLVKTERGLLQAEMGADGQVSVNMGMPIFDWADIPLAVETDSDHLPIDGDPAAVGMGNPHCIFFVPDTDQVDVTGRGGKIELHALFPKATNVEFIQVLSPTQLRMRVWERGTGITLACGSGACAAAVAGHRRGLCERRVHIAVDGGALMVDWREDGVWLSGPTAHVFSGTFSTAFLGNI
ncbi:MAG: diaminopimelate epimerase [Paracoccaceae bacterium]